MSYWTQSLLYFFVGNTVIKLSWEIKSIKKRVCVCVWERERERLVKYNNNKLWPGQTDWQHGWIGRVGSFSLWCGRLDCQVPLVIPVWMVLVSLHLLIAPRVELLYAACFVLWGLVFCVLLVHFKVQVRGYDQLVIFIQMVLRVVPSKSDDWCDSSMHFQFPTRDFGCMLLKPISYRICMKTLSYTFSLGSNSK